MPLYTYTCETCETTQEHIVRSVDRNKLLLCVCGGRLKRCGLEIFSMGEPEYQCAGIMADGSHVPGHFGKDAKRRRKKK